MMAATPIIIPMTAVESPPSAPLDAAISRRPCTPVVTEGTPEDRAEGKHEHAPERGDAEQHAVDRVAIRRDSGAVARSVVGQRLRTRAHGATGRFWNRLYA